MIGVIHAYIISELYDIEDCNTQQDKEYRYNKNNRPIRIIMHYSPTFDTSI